MQPQPAVCKDCGLPYPFGLDAVLSNDQWALIMGQPESADDPGGLLCANCILTRAGKLNSFVRARLILEKA